MRVFVSVKARKGTHTCMRGESAAAPPREGGSTHKRGREGGREMIERIFFPF